MGFKDLFKQGLESAKGAYGKTKSEIGERIELAKEERRADIESKRMAQSEARQIRRSARADRIKNIARFKEKQKEKMIKDKLKSPKKSFLQGKKVATGSNTRNNLTGVGLNVDYLGKPREEKPRKPMRWI